MEQTILSVSQINEYIKGILDSSSILFEVCVRGEISNYKVYPSGHHYFTLKDSSSTLRCVMFRGNAIRLRFRPENGMQILATGRITVFPRDGIYQLYCTRIVPDGVGDLHVAFEQLKEKLRSEGLFDQSHKTPIPRYPHTIAIITSGTGAAIHDMLRILSARYPLTTVIILPVRVQGVEAPPEICNAIRYANQNHLADLIITGRGGGSIEDLWAFNDEKVAREIYSSKIPIISAVGHEPDVTISDYVADLRAATPSNAAELAVPDQNELRARLKSIRSAITQNLNRQITLYRQRLLAVSKSHVLSSPTAYIQDKRLLLDYITGNLISNSQRNISKNRQEFCALSYSLNALNPLMVLKRGYSVTLDKENKIIRSIKELVPGNSIYIKMFDGLATVYVESVTDNAIEEEDNGKV